MAALVGCSALVLALPSVVSQATAQDKTPHPIAVALPARPPAGAVVLFCGKADEITANWVKRGSKDPAPWVAEADGCMSPRAGDITSEAEFGDCYIHLEFRATVDDQGRTRGHGNAGVGLQGRYEIQIMDSFGVAPEAHGCGSMYSQKAPRVNACKKPGEWQTFDIIFRAPRLNDDGAVTEKARATVFQNGILILNNEDFAGPTGIQYGEFRGEAKTGPIVLQGDHDPVQFRNIWVAPL
jgi:hypothetical protein